MYLVKEPKKTDTALYKTIARDLFAGKRLTQRAALIHYGVLHLPARIRDAKRYLYTQGYTGAIESRLIDERGKRVKEYYYNPNPKKETK